MTTTAPHSPRPSRDVLAVMGSALPAPYDRGMERLLLPLGPREAGTIPVPAYDFAAYRRRYGRPPELPRYLLAPGGDVTAPLTVRVLYRRTPSAPREHVDVTLPAGLPAGSAVTVPLPSGTADLTADLRLVGLRPLDPAGTSDDLPWQVTALLGNLAKLLWVIGAEHEEIARQLRDVAAQRDTRTAHGASLDLLGLDLGAPRFPPRPHTPDAHTLALFHLDEVPPTDRDGPGAPDAEATVVVDAAAPGDTARRGTNDGAHSGRTGRFSHAFGFGPAPGAVTVRDSPHLDLPATDPFTVEAVVRPDPDTTTTGAVVAKRAVLNAPRSAGWALTVGTFRGIDRNLRLSLSDGGQEVDLFADRDLGDGAFHHVAGVVDRQDGTVTALLYVDGTEVARRVTGGPADDPEAGPDRPGPALGALTSTADLVMGRGAERRGDTDEPAPYRGVLEEVRLSRRARTTFEPVTGESDARYRARLRIFHRWLLPTPGHLQDAVNEAVVPIAAAPGDPAPFEVREPDDVGVSGAHPVRVLPGTVPLSRSLTADGDQGATEESAVGTAAQDEPDFDPDWLIRHPDLHGLSFAGGEDSRRMQLVVLRALDALVARLAAQPRPPDGTLRVLTAYDPAGPGLHAVGRALLLDHDTLDTDRLAALAHAAGFGWVEHSRDRVVHVSQPRGEALRITSGTPPPTAGLPDVREGESLALGIEPDPSGLPETHIRWSVLRSGAGDAALPPERPGTLLARAAGDVSVRVEVVRHGHVAAGTRTLRIGLGDTALTAGHSISGTGLRDATETHDAGPRTGDFDPNMLHVRTDDLDDPPAPVDYGKADAHRMMQRVTSEALDRLLALLRGTPGALTVLTSYVPAEAAGDRTRADLHTQGRALVLRHAGLTARALAARAFDAGFDHIAVAAGTAGNPETVHVAVAAGEQPAVRGPDELLTGETARFTAEPAARPTAACFSDDGAHLYLAASGTHRITALTLRKPEQGGFPLIAPAVSRPVGPCPGALAFGGGRLYVAHEPLDRVSVLDPVTLTSVAPDITGPRPSALATDSGRLYVGFGGDHPTLRAYLLTTGQEAASLPLPAAPRSIAVPATGPSLYVVVDGGLWCRVARSTLTLGQTVATGEPEAGAATVTPDGGKLYVMGPGTAGAGARIRVYRPPAVRPVATIEDFSTDTVPAALALSGDGRLLYVASEDPAPEDAATPTGRVHVVDVATDLRLLQALSPGGSALAASPAGTPYDPCLVLAPRRSGTLLLTDPAPLGDHPPSPPRLVTELPLGTGAGEQVLWSSTPDDHGAVSFSTASGPVTTVTGVTPGRALVRATSLRGGGPRPYQCEVRLKRRLKETAGGITKEQYDLILNILNRFHPIGIECRTDRLRVLAGLRADEPDLFPVYTFPTYHLADPRTSPFLRLREDGRHG
ncbi:LamG-like jellyroll fold domain-containing protein [Streptomyces sp. NPDC047141]|uniref:LamG-like jellyroll fold domain-containing protein n=1 Tax=Streptomyces sp. NPDC047141 TaxID=3155738 RepID=UPI0033CA2BCB